MQQFNKDEPTELKRDAFIDLINTIFRQFSPLQREAIIFQVCEIIDRPNCIWRVNRLFSFI